MDVWTFCIPVSLEMKRTSSIDFPGFGHFRSEWFRSKGEILDTQPICFLVILATTNQGMNQIVDVEVL